MPSSVISVERLGKYFSLGHQPRHYQTLRDTLAGAWRRLRHRSSGAPAPREHGFWALRDVSFDLQQGDVLGIVGRNGSGKSTLLKVLSRITEPSAGQAVVRGRVGSLLEIGTGFHPELSGRENIFLSGAILGMKRAELLRKFNDIVEFAEVERFLDTPVKHYSSGMYLRLAFSVAAFLEPDILIVDEVLAVGDQAFQNKCLGKMEQVAGHGRTVLFVSHNLAAVSTLCNRALLLDQGQVAALDAVEPVLTKYLTSPDSAERCLANRTHRGGHGPIRFTSIDIRGRDQQNLSAIPCGDAVTFDLNYRQFEPGPASRRLKFFIHVQTNTGTPAFLCGTHLGTGAPDEFPLNGHVECTIPVLPLVPGEYRIILKIKAEHDTYDLVWDAARLQVTSGPFYPSGRLPLASSGPFLVQHNWKVLERPPAVPPAATASSGQSPLDNLGSSAIVTNCEVPV